MTIIMTKLTIIWVGLCSLISTLIMLIFRSAAFDICYSPVFIFTLPFHIPYLNLLPPLVECLISVGVLIFVIQFFFPIIIVFIFTTFYVLIFNKSMPSARIILWFLWFVFLWFSLFELNLVPYF